ncbi:MAG: glycosyltransferase, partial [Rhodospirillaceae bacterium]|nr:glycosyltransferase [Rhodospirillaceae bacterium]
LTRTTYPDFEVLVAVDEAAFAEPDRAAYLREIDGREGRVRVLTYPSRPFSYAWTLNWTAAQATGSILCPLNDDVETVTADWLEIFATRLALDGVGAVGAKLYNPNDTIQHAGVILGLGGVAGHAFHGAPRSAVGYFGRAALEQDLSAVTAACMAVRRAAFEAVGGFDEGLAIAFNDVDFCLRLRAAGWRILWTPRVEHYHAESQSLGRHDSPARLAQFEAEVAFMRARWGAALEADPCYNPNLSLHDPNAVIAAMPRLPVNRDSVPT